MGEEDQDRAELLAALDATTPEEFDEAAAKKGDLTTVRVPYSKDKHPPVYAASGYTKKWPYHGKAKKKRRKMQKASRRKNRKRRK